MNTTSSQDDRSGEHRLKEFFLARQPILNRDQSLIAYELLFRGAALGAANVTDDLSATAAVIAHASELGMTNVIGSALGFINVDATVLLSDFVHFLPSERVVLEILETVEVTGEIVARVAELAQAGYTFALDDVIADSSGLQQLLPFVSFIKIDITGMAYSELSTLAGRFRQVGKKLLAEKVETLEQFEFCLGLGFEYFQGYYFARPVIMQGRKLSPSQMALMQLVSQVIADADSAQIERSIKRDAALGLMLLKLVNTPGVGAAHRIDSLGQALMVIGRRQLRRWLQILLYAEPGKASQAHSPLLLLATTRGKLLELLAQKLRPNDRNSADIAFTVGIMSLMDTLFGIPMEEILPQLPVADDIAEALQHRAGFYGQLLNIAEYVERIEKAEQLLIPSLQSLQLSTEELCKMQLEAFEWSDSISRGAE